MKNGRKRPMTHLEPIWRNPGMALRSQHHGPCAGYWITLTAYRPRHSFGTSNTGRVELSAAGKIALVEWLRCCHFSSLIELDELIILPNHLHVILWARTAAGRCESGLRTDLINTIVNGYKADVRRRIHETGRLNFRWNAGHDFRAFANWQELIEIREYLHTARCLVDTSLAP